MKTKIYTCITNLPVLHYKSILFCYFVFYYPLIVNKIKEQKGAIPIRSLNNKQESKSCMKVVNLSQSNTLMNQFIAEIRDIKIQGDSLRFRRNIERIGEIMAYEISRELPYHPLTVQTPLAMATENVPSVQPVVATILRAGLPYHRGFINYFDRAENAFVSAYRKYIDADNFDIHIEYIASPRLDRKTLIITDPMLATGGSMEMAYQALLTKGEPAHIHIASVIASRQAVEHVQKVFPTDKTTVWCAAIDPELNAHSYIVPGLGDAGDLCYGEKE